MLAERRCTTIRSIRRRQRSCLNSEIDLAGATTHCLREYEDCSAGMNTIKVAIFAILLTATASSKAETPVDPVEARLEVLVRQSPKAGLPKLLDYNLKKLDAVFRVSLSAAEDAEHRRALEDSQKAWRVFFDADGAVGAWNAKGGSNAYPAQVEQRIYQVRLRIYQLSTPFLHGWAEIPRLPNPEAEKAGTEQPATRSASNSEGREKHQPETQGRSR